MPVPVCTTAEESENASYDIHSNYAGETWKSPKNPTIIGHSDFCSGNTRSGELHDYRSIAKVFPELTKTQSRANVFKFLWFEERFRKAPFLWRISVDGRPNRRN